MFRRFAGSIPGGANALFQLHPAELSFLLELAWDRRLNSGGVPGRPGHRSALPGLTSAFGLGAPAGPLAAFIRGLPRAVQWDHLIYAYMIENTRAFRIFRRVVEEFTSGERLGVPNGTAASQHWLRNTEELFYREPAPFTISAVTSRLRPDLDATRRSTYQRLLGMELNHGTDDNHPYPYPKAEAANREFVTTFEELLREVWIGSVNVRNATGPNPTDNGKIAMLVTRLRDMLLARRLYGNLSREEYVFVSTMSWFHLTLQYDSPIVLTLRAEAMSPEQRLFKIAERVGLPAHGLSKSFFDIADPVSRILILIESDAVSTPAQVPALYTPAPGGPEDDMRTIITHWSLISGRDMKAGKVTAG
ncbi:hypothetical protein [Streptomyces sp. NPDC093544]|uniref:hypothetical protein n=1 Tax=Streptomyces sp. NPDC093544 TaxID=3155200 RepID=UPI00341FF93A